MKARILILILGIIAAMAAGVGNGLGATNEVSGLLQKGLFEEEANHDLEAAIRAYQAVVTQTDKDHQFAATAIFRLGECYRKQGKTNEANAEYQRILREFSDQTELATLSRQQLGTAAPVTQPQAAVTASAAQIVEIQKLSPEKRRVAVQQMFPNPVLNSLMQKMTDTQQEAAVLKDKDERDWAEKKSHLPPESLAAKADHAPASQEFLAKQALLKSIYQEIDDQVDMVLAGANHAEHSNSDGNQPPQRSADDLNTDVKTFREAEEIKRLQAMIKDSPDLINATHPIAGGARENAPLIEAVRGGSTSVVRFLLENKADTEVRGVWSSAPPNPWGQTPIMVAASLGDVQIVEMLINHGADLNASAQVQNLRNTGYTALHFAAASGHNSVVDLLLNHGVPADQHVPETKDTALMIASSKGYKTVVETLLARGANVNAADIDGSTALASAINAGNKAITELLLARGADVNAADMKGKTALYEAVEKGNATMVELLLANKADVNSKTSDGLTPLIDAVNGKHPEIVKLLLEHGTDVNSKMSDTPARISSGSPGAPGQNSPLPRWTALDAAVSLNDSDMVKLLLEHHADPNLTFDLPKQSETNATPLMMAAWSRHKETAKLLLADNADVNMKEAGGWTALWKAFNNNYDRGMMELLLDNKADPDFKYQQGKTILYFAAERGDTNLVELFLAHGADVNVRDDFGWTPLHRAVLTGSLPIVEMLLAHGADVNAKDNQGNTPLDLATPHHNPYNPTDDVDVAVSEKIRSLLRGHGGVAEADVATIRVMRNGKLAPEIIFHKDTAGFNRYTLYEVVADVYGSRTLGNMSQWPVSLLQFPDFSKLKIIHLVEKGQAKGEPVDLEKTLAAGDCSGNIPLRWGDIVEIPEADHKVTEQYYGLSEQVKNGLRKCLAREVQIIVKGQTNDVKLLPEEWPQMRPINLPPGPGASYPVPLLFSRAQPTATNEIPKTVVHSFWLRGVVSSANVILESSDLTRVKVKRGERGKMTELVVNINKQEPNSDAWLENGDVIEIPEKTGE